MLTAFKMASERYSITTGVLDNDPKGLTGRGTVFWMVIERAGKLIEAHEWGLLDQIAGLFKPNEITKKYKELNLELDRKEAEKEAAWKALEATRRALQVKEDPQLLALIDETISSETKAITEYLSGKEKALNAVVGKIIGLCKKQSVQADAFKITTLLKKRLNET